MADKKIPGIHNYCDRWCERCYFTSRCAIYDDESGSGDLDESNKAFWERLSVNLSKAHDMLEKMAEEAGIDLNAVTEDKEYEIRQEKIRKDSKDHPLGKLSWAYSEASRKWMQSQPGMEKKLEELRDEIDLGVESFEDAKAKTETIKDSLEIIQWYQNFIHVKFLRSLMGRMRLDGFDDIDEDQRDSDGSAKIAIISIERSMQAWVQLFGLLPEQEDEFLKILGMLDKLKSMALQEFPKAMAFKRPGFDD